MSTRPLLFADLIAFINLTTIETRDDWLNTDWMGYKAHDVSARASFEACGETGKADEGCLQRPYHLRTYHSTGIIRLGHQKPPRKGEKTKSQGRECSAQGKRSLAGWDIEGIKRGMRDKGRDCSKARWVTSSLKRIF